LRHRERPVAVQYLSLWPIQAHGVVPAIGDWQAVDGCSFATAKLNDGQAIIAALGCQAVERIGRVVAGLNMSNYPCDVGLPGCR
jgi:hypothetical protein